MKNHIPNAITCCNLVCGGIATGFAFSGDFELALTFIILGAAFDFFDGMSARLLGVSSPIGKELDSLADNVTFGLAPSAMLFAQLQTIGRAAWWDGPMAWLPYTAFLMSAFSALRLAKFNLDDRQTSSFIGLPTPANALFWAAFLVSCGSWLADQSEVVAWLLVALMVGSCWLLVAELPLFALKFKHWGWHGNEQRWMFLVSSALFILFFGQPGIAFTIVWYVFLNVYNLLMAKIKIS